MNKTLPALIAAAFAFAPALAHAQVTLTTGAEFTSGKYGEPDKTDTWTIPLALKYDSGPWTLKLSMPWTRVKGTVNRETGESVSELLLLRGNGTNECTTSGSGKPEDNPPPGCPTTGGGSSTTTTTTSRTAQTQSGVADITAAAYYTVLDPARSAVGLDVGGKVKFVVGNKDKCLLTTGKTDYSVQADVYQDFGRFSPYLTLGWTKKGDPEARDLDCKSLGEKVNFRNPWYSAVGFSYKFTDAMSLGLSYDYREKITSRGDPISEATVTFTHRLSPAVKLQVYGIAGFSDNSPDWGIGATVGYTF